VRRYSSSSSGFQLIVSFPMLEVRPAPFGLAIRPGQSWPAIPASGLSRRRPMVRTRCRSTCDPRHEHVAAQVDCYGEHRARTIGHCAPTFELAVAGMKSAAATPSLAAQPRVGTLICRKSRDRILRCNPRRNMHASVGDPLLTFAASKWAPLSCRSFGKVRRQRRSQPDVLVALPAPLMAVLAVRQSPFVQIGRRTVWPFSCYRQLRHAA